MLPDVGVVELGVGRLDCELPAARHGVPSVHGQVHDHLLELARVGLHSAQGGVEARHECDVFAQQPAQHVLGVRHNVVEVEDAHLHDLLAAERQQLTGESRGALGGLADLRDIVAAPVGRAKILEQQVGVASDRREDVVEVVGDAARETPNGLHLLRLTQLLLEAEPLRDVPADS